jgi:hypothetical protein
LDLSDCCARIGNALRTVGNRCALRIALRTPQAHSMTQTAPEAPQRKTSRLRRIAAVVILGFIGGIATSLGRTAGAELPDWLQLLL